MVKSCFCLYKSKFAICKSAFSYTNFNIALKMWNQYLNVESVIILLPQLREQDLHVKKSALFNLVSHLGQARFHKNYFGFRIRESKHFQIISTFHTRLKYLLL